MRRTTPPLIHRVGLWRAHWDRMNIFKPDEPTPGIVRAAEDLFKIRCDKWASGFKSSHYPLRNYLRDNLDELARIKSEMPHGGWGKFLKRIGVTRSIADHWLERSGKFADGEFEIFGSDSEDESPEQVTPSGAEIAVSQSSDAITDKPLCDFCRTNGPVADCKTCWEMTQASAQTTTSQTDLFGGSSSNEPAALPKGWKKCPLCKAKKARDSSKCDACKILNAPPATSATTPDVEEKPEPTGPDITDYLSFWKRTGKTLGKRIKQMKNALVIPREDIDDARKAYAALGQFIAKHAESAVRPQEAGKCKKCGADVVWTTTASHSRIPLDVRPGGGVWEVIDGVAHFCEWDKEAAKFRFRCHSARCVTNKPIPD